MAEFFLGLAIGLLLLAWQRVALSKQLRQLLAYFDEESLPPYFSQTSRLLVAAAQQRQRQQDLQSILASLRQLINYAPIAYLQIDPDNHLLWCNQAASELVAIADPSPTTPRLLLEQVRSYDLDQLIELTRQQQQICQRQWVLHPLNPDPLNPAPRQTLYLLGYGIPLPDGQVGVFLENRQEVMQIAQQRDRWVSDVAHELKTPLTSIRLVAEMIESRVDPMLKPWVERLLGEVIHLSNLVHDLLDLSRLERRAAQSLSLSSVQLPSLIESAWQTLEPITAAKDIQMIYQGPQRLAIEADQSRLYRVVLNLLDNATKYSPPSSTIQIQLAQTDQEVCLDVIDSGPGFPEEAIAHVFERFYRADPARARTASTLGQAAESSSANLTSIASCGLGLAIVWQIIEAHAGKVTAQNHPDTHGAWIQVKLPLPITASAL